MRRRSVVHEWLRAARDADLPVITSAAAVLAEVLHLGIHDAALKWDRPPESRAGNAYRFCAL